MAVVCATMFFKLPYHIDTLQDQGNRGAGGFRLPPTSNIPQSDFTGMLKKVGAKTCNYSGSAACPLLLYTLALPVGVHSPAPIFFQIPHWIFRPSYSPTPAFSRLSAPTIPDSSACLRGHCKKVWESYSVLTPSTLTEKKVTTPPWSVDLYLSENEIGSA